MSESARIHNISITSILNAIFINGTVFYYLELPSRKIVFESKHAAWFAAQIFSVKLFSKVLELKELDKIIAQWNWS